MAEVSLSVSFSPEWGRSLPLTELSEGQNEMTDTTNNSEDISAAPSVRGYYDAPFSLLWKPSFPQNEHRGCQLSGRAHTKLEIVPRRRLPETSLENRPKVSAHVPGGHLARSQSTGAMVTSPQDRTSPGEGVTLAFGCSHRAGLIFLSLAVGSFKANWLECVSWKNLNVISNRAPLSQTGLLFSSVQDEVRLRARDAG